MCAAATLSQIQDGEERVLAYASKTLSKAEQLYCVTRKELLAVVFFVKHYRCYLVGRNFRIRTDHASLQYLHKSVNLLGQSARWLQFLEEFTYKIEHRKGTSHINADSLTRMKCKQCGIDADPTTHYARSLTTNASAADVSLSVENFDEKWTPAHIAEMTENDEELKPIINLLQIHDQQPGREDVLALDYITKRYWAQWPRLVLKNGILYRKWETADGSQQSLQWIPPRSCRTELIKTVHSGFTGGHYAASKTMYQVQRRAYWATWKSDVKYFCLSCVECATYHRGTPSKKGRLQPFIAGNPWEIVSIDICGPFPVSERSNRFIITMVDHFSKYSEAFCVPNHRADTVAREIMHGWVARYGTPLKLLSDMGPEFESELMQELCKYMNIRKLRTTPYKASANANAGRFHRSLNSILAKIMQNHEKHWDEYVPFALAAYRNTVHDSTSYSPNHIIFGKEVSNPIDIVLGDSLKLGDVTDPPVFTSTHEYVANFTRENEILLRACAQAVE